VHNCFTIDQITQLGTSGKAVGLNNNHVPTLAARCLKCSLQDFLSGLHFYFKLTRPVVHVDIQYSEIMRTSMLRSFICRCPKKFAVNKCVGLVTLFFSGFVWLPVGIIAHG
jgi:hypothetical protein